MPPPTAALMDLRAALARLPARRREAMVLFYIGDLSIHGMQLCHFLITKKDGTSEELGDLTLSFGADTRDLTFEVPVAFEDLEDFDLSCGPLDE